MLTMILLIYAGFAVAESYQLKPQDSKVEIWQFMERFYGGESDVPPYQSTEWKPLSESELNRGIDNQMHWLRLVLSNPSEQPIEWVMLHENSYVDLVEAYIHNAAGELIETINLDDHKPFSERPIAYRKPAFSFITAPDDQTIVYIRTGMWVADSNTLRFLLSSKQQFEQQRIDEQFAFGLYYGASIALIVLSLLLWLSLKTPLFLVYGLYLVSNTMLWFSLNGFAFQHFWPNSPQWHNNSFHIIFMLFVLFAIEFSKHFFDIRKETPRLWRYLTAFQLIMLIGIGARLAGHYPAVLYLAFASIAATAALPILGWYFYRRGLIYARWYVLAWSVFVAGLLLSLLSASTSVFNWGMNPLLLTQMASLLESFTLLLALSEKVRILQYRYEQAERESQHDALTGIGNRRLLERWFKRWSNSDDSRQRLWVILIDIDNFKEVNDIHGHRAGDQVLQQLADMMTQLSRPQDILVRYGGEEFLLLAESPEPKYVVALAERLRQRFARTPHTLNDIQIPHTISLGISELQPDEDKPLEQALMRADKALYQAKDAGKNRVVMN
ncbi:sensor domain-containing diguanylate cyclase [Methylophaga lonarensis]|uniref:sensor domain-containing diguanylate cyclase n=1 Tax=Methylophaga lonarensis TaxID=999151 RepID=UPI003D2C009C